MSLDAHVRVTITINNSGVALAGFGLIAILTYTSLFPERSKLYSRTAAMITDGFASTSPEVRAAGRILAQSPHPTKVLLVRGTRKPTQKYQLSARDIRNSSSYKIKVKGEGVTDTTATYTSDASATKPEIHNGLVTQLNAVVGKNYTAAFAALVFADIVFTADNTTEIFTSAAHGLLTGDGPFQVSNSGGALPAGLAAVTDYYIIKIDANTFKLATSLANALAGTFLSITTNGTGTQTLADTVNTKSPSAAIIATGDAAGNWFSLEVMDRTALDNAQIHVDPGIADDLAEIRTADDSFYYLYTYFNSDPCLLVTAEWAEENGKMAYLDSCNTQTENTAVTNGDAWDDVLGLNYKRTLPCYHSSPAQMYGAGLMGRLAPLNPGRWTAAYKTIVGVEAMTFTDTQFANLDARKVTYYKLEAGRSISWEGKVTNTDYAFADVVTALDFFLDALQKRVFGVFVGRNIVDYTDEDIKLIESAAKGVVRLCMSDAYKFIAKGTPGDPADPEPTVIFPRVADVDPSVRSLRQLPDGAVSFRYAGAIHSALIDVTVSF